MTKLSDNKLALICSVLFLLAISVDSILLSWGW